MADIASRNVSIKALKSHLASIKNTDEQALVEYEIGFQNNGKRGRVYDQTELQSLYSNVVDWDTENGASKVVHTVCHNGRDFEYIVVKRHRDDGHIFRADSSNGRTGNQLIDEIKFWKQYMDKPESDLLCPISKYFTSKSDKVEATSKKMQYNVLIIAQKAVYVDNAFNTCIKADSLNMDAGLKSPETWEERYNKLMEFADSNNWRDAIYNCGNSGVIFDYAKGYYKAVFIDYAL